MMEGGIKQWLVQKRKKERVQAGWRKGRVLKWTEKGTLEAQEIGNTTGDRRAQEVEDLVRWGLGITVEQSQVDVMRNRRTLFQ